MPYYSKHNNNVVTHVGKSNSDKNCYVVRKLDSGNEKTTLDLIRKGDVFRCFDGDETDVFEGCSDCIAKGPAEIDPDIDITYVKVAEFEYEEYED